MEKQTRFNPLRGWTPDVLVRQLEAYARGELAPLAWVMEWLQKHDDIIATVAPKAFSAVSRHGYDVLPKEEIDPSLKKMAEDQQGVMQRFFQSLETSDAVELEEQGGMRLLVQQIMDAYGKGYAGHHIIWRPSRTEIQATLVKVPTWFFEATTGRLRFLPASHATHGVELETLGGRDAWMISKGRGVMLAGVLARMFKQLPLQDWLTYCDRHGMPAFLGKTSAEKGTQGWSDMASAVAGIGAEYGAVVNTGDVIDVLDLAGQGEVPYVKLIDRMDRAQVMLWRGGDLSTMSRENGTGSNPQQEATDELDADNACWVSETINRNLTKRVIEWHFGRKAPVLVEIKLRTATRDNVTQDLATVKVAKEMGVRISKSWFTGKFGIVEADDGEAALGEVATPGTTALNSGDKLPDAPDAAMETFRTALAADMQPLGDALFSAYQAGDYPATLAALKKISKDMPKLAGNASNLAGALAKQFATAFVGGETDAANAGDRKPRFRRDGSPWADYNEEKHKRDAKGRYAFKPVREWKPDESLPEISTEDARTILKEGRDVVDPLGKGVRFDTSLETHWKNESKDAWDISRRLGQLPEAIRTVEHPHEVWREAETTIYLHRHGPKEGMTTFVESTSGKAATYYPAEHFAKLQAKLNKLTKNPENLLWSREMKEGQD